MKGIFLIACISSLLFTGEKEWYTDFDKAKAEAAEKHEYILLNFAGSDWCVGCIKMEKEVFETETFKDFADKKLVLVKADFPRLKKNRLPEEQQKKNDQLAERYNPNGYFPYTVLLDPSGKQVRAWEGFYDQGTNSFINEIDEADGN